MKVNRDAARARAREALDRGGRWWRAGASWRRATARRAVAVGLTGLLLFGQVPAAAWAAEAEALGRVAQNVVAFAQNAGEGITATDAVGAEGTAADGAAGAGDTAAGADSAEGTIATDAGDGATSAATDDASPETAADAAPATDAPATDAAAPSAADGTTAPDAASQAHTGAAYLLIQDVKDAASSEGSVEGAVSAGATLWANLFIGGEDADGADADAAVAAQDGWSYQWYACGTASARIDDYEPIAGQTAQSLVLTEDLAEQLAGSYLAVAVTVDGECHVGPTQRSTVWHRAGRPRYRLAGRPRYGAPCERVCGGCVHGARGGGRLPCRYRRSGRIACDRRGCRVPRRDGGGRRRCDRGRRRGRRPC